MFKLNSRTSLCMLFEVVTIDLHYMTDRQERFDLKISKLKNSTAKWYTVGKYKFNDKQNEP